MLGVELGEVAFVPAALFAREEPVWPVVVDGVGRLLADGLVGTGVLAKAELVGLGFIQLSQPLPMPVLWQPVSIKQGNDTTPAANQARH